MAWYDELDEPTKNGLHGWHHEESERSRHEALERAVHADGYRTVIDRMNRLRAISGPKSERSHPGVYRAATTDEHWLEERHRRQLHEE